MAAAASGGSGCRQHVPAGCGCKASQPSTRPRQPSQLEGKASQAPASQPGGRARQTSRGEASGDPTGGSKANQPATRPLPAEPRTTPARRGAGYRGSHSGRALGRRTRKRHLARRKSPPSRRVGDAGAEGPDFVAALDSFDCRYVAGFWRVNARKCQVSCIGLSKL